MMFGKGLGRTDHWCILRTSGQRTLLLADWLIEHGYDAWTPVEHRPFRVRRTRDREHRPVAAMPTYVFARALHVTSLLALAADPGGDNPPFSVLRFRDRIPMVADADLDLLRAYEDRHRRLAARRAEKARRARTGQPLRLGSAVTVADGPFAGLTGIVEESDGRFTLLGFGRMGVKIETFLISPETLDHVAA